MANRRIRWRLTLKATICIGFLAIGALLSACTKAETKTEKASTPPETQNQNDANINRATGKTVMSPNGAKVTVTDVERGTAFSMPEGQFSDGDWLKISIHIDNTAGTDLAVVDAHAIGLQVPNTNGNGYTIVLSRYRPIGLQESFKIGEVGNIELILDIQPANSIYKNPHITTDDLYLVWNGTGYDVNLYSSDSTDRSNITGTAKLSKFWHGTL